ncbi:MAG: hypothetical protein ACLQBB_09570 [Solirubrobacteraceae bacterium]
MSQRAPLRAQAPPLGPELPYDGRGAAVQRRRARSALVRRRRLLLADLCLGGTLALIGLIAAPGLAIVALGAAVVLGGCAASIVYERGRTLRARRHTERRGVDGRSRRRRAAR